jgi:threonyl-tRNA synthetase
MKVQIKDKKIDISENDNGKTLAEKLNLSAPNQALAISINGQVKDLSTKLDDNDNVSFISFEDPQGKEIFWHTSAHVLAQAVKRLYPEAKPTIGPPIENGFYYDFADLKITDNDFEQIEKEIEKILNANYPTERKEFQNKESALNEFFDNPYKIELIESFEDNCISGYQQGEFFDLCRGPHLPNLGKIKAFKILKTSGAYWRGDQNNEMLTRIYGISFPDRKSLKNYLQMLEEAKKNDHKIIGPKLDLFSYKEEAPGMPFIHNRGMIIWNSLIDYLRECLTNANYLEIKTPTMMTKDLWEKSGHWENYKENMFISEIEDREFAIKPMNCPGCMLYYKTTTHSYREFPLRIAEIGQVHRYEPSGALSGLFRVRSFHQDDAHIFMRFDMIKDEILEILNLADQIYMAFGLSYKLELSTRPEKSIGTDKDWEIATKGLQDALDTSEHSYKINEGDGAFYGPKIDIHIKDALSRYWQCGTIQLDLSLPEKFKLEYVDSDGEHKRPVMIHRALFGSIERFFGILIEHFAGKFPLWISPYQLRIVPVADRHAKYAYELKKKFTDNKFICDVDDSKESVSKKIRNAQALKYNYIITVGDDEMQDNNIALRTRDNTVHRKINLQEFIALILDEIKQKSLMSFFPTNISTT